MTSETPRRSADKPPLDPRKTVYGSPELGYTHDRSKWVLREDADAVPQGAAIGTPEQVVAGEIRLRSDELAREMHVAGKGEHVELAALAETHENAHQGARVLEDLRERVANAKAAVDRAEGEIELLREGQRALREKRPPPPEFMACVEKMEAEAAGRLSRAFESASTHRGSLGHERELQDARNRMASIAGLKERIQELGRGSGRGRGQR